MRRLVLDVNDPRPVWAAPPWVEQQIRAALPSDWEIQTVGAPADGRGDGGAPSAEVMAAVRGAEVYVGYGIQPELFHAATAPPHGCLRWVHSAAAGVGGSLHEAMVQSEVVLTNSAGIHAAPIAETVLAMMLHFTRGLDFAVRAQAEHRWDKESFDAADTPVCEISGATMGIIGFGGIGREVARRADALGMRVLAVKRTPGETPPGVELLTGNAGLDRLLERSDVLVVAVPETPTTRGLVGARELALLPRGAILINVARGRVLDEAALIEAVRAGRLRGAALDVFEREPLSADSPLWDLPGVLITPHVSGTSRQFWRREADLIVRNIGRYLAEEPLLNAVNKQHGY
jgi:phosphoglycerate dehydrogenase-like enzyme